MLYRDDKDQREAVTYLEDLGANVLPVKWLHSKIYINESTALASSMNLLESSFNNSSEFCIRIDRAHTNNGRLYNELDNYVERIRQRAERGSPSETGQCRRCGRQIPLNPNKPLCLTCWRAGVRV